ncbi:nuclear transport factor 2 family protein [Streptomyces parvus]|uniref:Nuclear transport factor 2 family protein n=1 Tax=Streptomyces parvus TaxID=66428 RepID=A0A7K3RN81_9ACTN|nr:nuclear transport factor 2 family protein [Streptomyces parvus]NEC16696.1 nuclear transport factor 2 family protein [Streptomyces parvus]
MTSSHGSSKIARTSPGHRAPAHRRTTGPLPFPGTAHLGNRALRRSSAAAQTEAWALGEDRTEERKRTSTATGAEEVISAWIAATNTHDTEKYLAYFTDDAELDDQSVGDRFTGKERIAEYCRSYFIGYDTTTRIVTVEPTGGHFHHVVVEFAGDFPGVRAGGIFDVALTGDRIARVRADLT